MEQTRIDVKILNQLRNGRTAKGMVGCRVKPTSDNDKNQAWVTVVMIKTAECKDGITYDTFHSYEVEYLEFAESYDEEVHGYDWDQFLVRTEKYDNIKSERALESLLGKWLEDVNALQPVANIDLPNF